MSTLLSLLVLLPALLSGIFLVDLAWRDTSGAGRVCKFFLGCGLGLGASTCLGYFSLLAFGARRLASFWLDLAALAVLLILWLRAWRRGEVQPLLISFSFNRRILLPLLALGLSAAAALLIFLSFTMLNPNGDFDAWTMWNLRARFLFRAGADWQTAFSDQMHWMFHADYPLLLPLLTLKAWSALGLDTPRAPILIAALFLFCSVGLLTAYLARVGWLRAALAGMLLLAAPRYLDLAAFQVADVPLSFFILAGILLGVESGRAHTHRSNLLALAGLAFGLAAWTKNDGILSLLAAALVGAGLLLRQLLDKTRNLRRSAESPLYAHAGQVDAAGQTISRAAAALLGGAPPFFTLLVFKLFLAPPGDMLAGQTLAGAVQKLGDFSRYALITRALLENLWQLGEYPLPIVPCLLVFAWSAGRRKLAAGETNSLAWAGLTLAVTLLGYGAVYLLTPHPLDWHLQYSADRLLLQLYPAALCLLFVVFLEKETL